VAVEPELNPVRTVIADDSELIRRLLSSVLEGEPGFAVVGEAANGHEALALVEGDSVDLLVLDLSMPELDGLEVLERLAATGREVCTVVYSGWTVEAVERRARALGARDFVTKDVPLSELIGRLRAAVRE
jgi:DNA-binding NarL/FixJ family response regulator